MKKQNPPVSLIKKDLSDILKKELSRFPTKEELKAELKTALANYPTKDDFTEILQTSQKTFRIEMRNEFSRMKEDVLAGMSKFTNLILTAIDPLMKELETRQQYREISAAQIKGIEYKVDDHEKRINKLEHS